MEIVIRGIEFEEAWALSLNEFNGVIRVWDYGKKEVKFETRKINIGFVGPSIWYK